MRNTVVHRCVGCVCVLACAVVAAQQGSSKGVQPEFQAVDQGVGDRTGLSASYRDMGVDLRAPMNFDRVYKVDARSRMLKGVRGWRGGAYARAQGGLVALFPQSAYREVAPGVDLAQVPAGTVYTLADTKRMNGVDERPESTRPSARIVAGPIVARVEGTPQGVPAVARSVPPAEQMGSTIWTDEEFRRRRVVQLLEWAERERGG